MSATSGNRPWPLEAGGEVAVVRLQHRGASGPERRHVRLHRRVLPHAAVHGRGEEHGAADGEEQRPQEVVGEPERRAREGVGRGRRDEVRSARSASATCSTAAGSCGSNRSVRTGRPDSVRKVSGATNSRAWAVITTVTAASARRSSRSRYAAL